MKQTNELKRNEAQSFRRRGDFLDNKEVLQSNTETLHDQTFREEGQTAKEASLVRLAQAGDQTAFSRLVQPYMRLAYHVALRITGNREDAEDASQQSLLKAFVRLDQFNGESLFSTWLTRIAINEALMKVRKRRSEDCHLLHETNSEQESSPVDQLHAGEDFHPELLYVKWEKQRLLRDAIDSLQGTSRAVVWLLGIQERKTKEAAKLLNLSESAVKSRFLRARQQLRESLEHRI
jgi:RNA polymerase sigma-70 factor (ECF subfamily)